MTTLLQRAAAHVRYLYNTYPHHLLVYHNLAHTEKVVKHVGELIAYYRLSTRSELILLLAAWFHDTGQLTGEMEGHEETSVRFFQAFLATETVDADLEKEVAECILATKMPVKPVNQLQNILCDADTWHLGSVDFHRLDSLVWQELELRTHRTITNQAEKSLAFLLQHQFYTSYCQERLQPIKDRNIALLQIILNTP